MEFTLIIFVGILASVAAAQIKSIFELSYVLVKSEEVARRKN